MKKEIRILGIDDAPFNKFKDRDVIVIGAFFRGGESIDGVLSAKVEVDGTDSTEKLIEMVNKSRFRPQIQAILLDGIAFGGFNVVDIVGLYEKTKIPVIVVMRNHPDLEGIEKVLVKLKKQELIKLLHKAGKIHIQTAGIELKDAKEIIKLTSTRSHIPEPIRVAHLIGAGLVLGESKGNA